MSTGAEMLEHRSGRIFRSSRRVRLADVDPDGRTRMDAIARYLQDVAVDDVRDAGVAGAVAWVVRRTTIVATRRPVYEESVEVATWCSGTGSALAERRTVITGEHGGRVDAVSLWVSLDRRTMRPVPLGEDHFGPYYESAGDRHVRSRFVLAPAPADPPGARWPLRAADFDILGHANNAVAWAAAEDAVGGRPIGAGQVEYRRPIAPDTEVMVKVARRANHLSLWLTAADGSTLVSAVVDIDGN